FGAFLILEDLSYGGLADVQIGVSLEMMGRDLVVGFHRHDRCSWRVDRAIEARIATRAVDSKAVESTRAATAGLVSTGGMDEQDDPARTHAAIPSRRRSASPCRSPLAPPARTAVRRTS